MEKYSQFRDRASGIAPFLPVAGQGSAWTLPFRFILFAIRLPILLSLLTTYLLLIQWIPVGSWVRKFFLWTMAMVSGVLPTDLQVEGVKKGSVAQHPNRLPRRGTIIAASFTSPIDTLYLAAMFNPVFTISYPLTRKVRRISVFEALLLAFAPPQSCPKTGVFQELEEVVNQHPRNPIVIYPECTTSNGSGVLELSPSLASAARYTRIFPLSLRYTPADITTPIPRSYVSFLWHLLSQTTHTVRIRIGAEIALGREGTGKEGLEEQMTLLALVGDSLARLGRIKRVGLGVSEKREFVKIWSQNNSSWFKLAS